MATFKYFDTTGTELNAPYLVRNNEFTAKFPGVKGVRVDSFSRWVGTVAGELRPVARVIEFKSNPSLHKCDGRCLHAKGRTCECSCGGANHGTGG